jgi:hypothetical protein
VEVILTDSTRAPGQAGAIQPVKVRPRQGRSGPPGSKCCAAVGDGGREAYTAVMWGVGMSHEIQNIVGAETVSTVEGNMCGTAMRGAVALPGSKATSRAKGSHRKLGGLGSDRSGAAVASQYREGEEP